MGRFYLLLMVIVVFVVNGFVKKNSYEIGELLREFDIHYTYIGDDVVSVDGGDVYGLIECLDVEVYDVFNIDGRVIFEGYCSYIKNSTSVGGKKTNIQISVVEDYMLIGSPLIDCSF